MQINEKRTFARFEGISPQGKPSHEFKIWVDLIKKWHKIRPDHVIGNVWNIPQGVSSPLAIFEGLKRENHDRSYCYVSRPARFFVNENDNVPAWKGYLFLIFVSQEFEIFDWRFEKADDTEKDYPIDWVNRFDRLLWKP